MLLLQNGKRFVESRFSQESTFEEEIVRSHKQLFGSDTIYIDAKRKIGCAALGSAIPDGFLFDMSDPDNREFYLVEVELARHSFYEHIFPQITKFFAFFNRPMRQHELVEKLFSIITGDSSLKQQFKKYLGEKEIYKFLNEVADSSQNILIVIDGPKPEFPEIMDTYADTWGRMVKVITVQKFDCDGETILATDPEFDAIEYSYGTAQTQNSYDQAAVSEEFHLEQAGDLVKDIYRQLKEEIIKGVPSAMFNITKNYISIRGKKNVAFLYLRKKKLSVDLLMNEERIRQALPNLKIRSLPRSAQSFYNSPCAQVELTGGDHLDELVPVIDELVRPNG